MTEHHPMQNRLPELEVPLDLLMREHAMHARQLQAEAMAASLASAWERLSRGARTTAVWLREQRRRARTRNALMACTDRTLADIGIPRDLVPLAARGIDLNDPAAVSEVGLWPRLAHSIQRMQEKRRHQRSIYRELSAYSDRDLEEIGVRRSDIPAIARTAYRAI